MMTGMSPREAKKRWEERKALDVFLEMHGSPHDEPLGGRPGAEPDFLVTFTGEGRIGIELTNDVWRERRHIEESRQEVVDLARQEYESRSSIPLEVSCHFGHEQVESDRRAQAVRIAEIVEQMMPSDAERIAQVGNNALYDKGLPNLVGIIVVRSRVLSRNYWSVTDAGRVRVVTPSEIEATIAKKEAKHSGFLARGRGWLVIYSVDDRLSGISDMGEEARRATYRARFSRVFALNIHRRELIEFRVT